MGTAAVVIGGVERQAGIQKAIGGRLRRGIHRREAGVQRALNFISHGRRVAAVSPVHAQRISADVRERDGRHRRRHAGVSVAQRHPVGWNALMIHRPHREEVVRVRSQRGQGAGKIARGHGDVGQVIVGGHRRGAELVSGDAGGVVRREPVRGGGAGVNPQDSGQRLIGQSDGGGRGIRTQEIIRCVRANAKGIGGVGRQRNKAVCEHVTDVLRRGRDVQERSGVVKNLEGGDRRVVVNPVHVDVGHRRNERRHDHRRRHRVVGGAGAGHLPGRRVAVVVHRANRDEIRRSH
jgi:hypothetical protein